MFAKEMGPIGIHWIGLTYNTHHKPHICSTIVDPQRNMAQHTHTHTPHTANVWEAGDLTCMDVGLDIFGLTKQFGNKTHPYYAHSMSLEPNHVTLF